MKDTAPLDSPFNPFKDNSESETDKILKESQMMKIASHPEYNGLQNIPKEIPMYLLSEFWAKTNHQQTLQRLNQRGGMGVMEVLDNLKRQGLNFAWRKPTQKDVDELNKILKQNSK